MVDEIERDSRGVGNRHDTGWRPVCEPVQQAGDEGQCDGYDNNRTGENSQPSVPVSARYVRHDPIIAESVQINIIIRWVNRDILSCWDWKFS